MPEPSDVQTAEKWLRSINQGPLPKEQLYNVRVSEVQARDRAVRRKTLVDAAMATCHGCRNKIRLINNNPSIHEGGALCRSRYIEDLIVKLDAEGKTNGSQEEETKEDHQSENQGA